ncbi:MAG: SdpI family protein [Gemmatimonadaceae bacterium]
MRKWIPPAIIAVAFIASAAVYSDLPARVPSHWNVAGEIDGWMNKEWGAFVMPLTLVGLLAMLHVLPRIDPRGANYSKFRSTFESVMITTMAFLLAVHLTMLAIALGKDVSMTRVIPLGIGLLLIVLGNLMPRTRSNWFVGIRTPWTLSNDRVWERTHRLGGRLMVAAGALVMLAGIFAPLRSALVLIASAVTVSVVVFAYSYVIWRTDPDARKNPAGRA